MVRNTTPTVDAISKINISGDVIPPTWYKHVTYLTEKGIKKTDHLAVCILANVRYWYTQTLTRDQKTDEVVSINKKFNSDLLQKSYEDYAELFGCSKKQIRESFNTLEALRLVTITFRNIKIKGGMLYNVMFIEPNPERISEITFNCFPKREEVLSQMGNHPCPNGEAPPPKWEPTSAQMGDTYTKITTENTPEITPKNTFFGEKKDFSPPKDFSKEEERDLLEELREKCVLKELTPGGLIQFLIDKNNGCTPIYYNDLLSSSSKIIKFLDRLNMYSKHSKAQRVLAKLETFEKWINRFTFSRVLETIDTVEGQIAMGTCTESVYPKYFTEALIRNTPDELSHLEPDGDDYKYVCKCGHKTLLHDDLKFCSICGTEINYDVTEEYERVLI